VTNEEKVRETLVELRTVEIMLSVDQFGDGHPKDYLSNVVQEQQKVLAQAVRDAKIEAYDEAEKKLRALPRYEPVANGLSTDVYCTPEEDGDYLDRDDALHEIQSLKDSLQAASAS
jgi:hypothetical protein